MTLRTILPAIIAIAAFSSCASAYRTGQTPDDVYYSPARGGGAAAYASTDQQRDGRGGYYQGRNNRNNDYYSYDDRWLRMRVMNRYRWSAFDDYDWNDWRYNTWSYNAYSPYGWNNYWSGYYNWNSMYNPYCGGIIILNPKTNPAVYTKVRNFSLGSYTNTNYNTANSANAKGIRMGTNNSRYNNSNSGLGNSIRKVFSGSNRDSYYSPSSSDRPTRTYTPNNNSSSNSSNSGSRSSGSSGGSSGGGGVSRPSRGN